MIENIKFGSFTMPLFNNEFLKAVKNNEPNECKIFNESYSKYIDFAISSVIKADFRKKYMANDLKEIGNYSLGVCLSKFDPENSKVNFFFYFKSALDNEFLNYFIKQSREQAHIAISLNQTIIPKTKNGLLYSDIIGQDDKNILGTYDAHKTWERIEENFESVLTKEEKDIFLMRMQDKTFAEIARECNCNEKHVRYIYAKAKKLLMN